MQLLILFFKSCIYNLNSRFIAYKKLLIMHCLMSSEEWHRKIPFTGYLLAISISVPVVDLESVRRVASGAQNIVFLAGWELLEY